MIKLFLFIVILLSAPAQARRFGNESGGGGGVLAKLLVSSQEYLKKELPRIPAGETFSNDEGLRRLYLKVARQIPDDLAQLKLTATNETLTDQRMGYVTWIRILPGNPMTLEYSPDSQLFLKLVDTRLLNSAHDDETPRLRDVMAFLLHEMGHYYGLGEEDAWRFALGLQAELDQRSAARLKNCSFTYADPSGGAMETLAKSFTLGGMDSYLFTTPKRIFSIAHVFRTNSEPQLSVSVTNSETRSVELSLFIAANSQVSLLQSLGANTMLNLQCEIK